MRPFLPIALLLALSYCATLPPQVTTTSIDEQRGIYEVHVLGGTNDGPEDVKEAFGNASSLLCHSDGISPGYSVLEAIREPQVLDPDVDLAESPYTHLLARGHYDVYTVEMDEIIGCNPPRSPASSR